MTQEDAMRAVLEAARDQHALLLRKAGEEYEVRTDFGATWLSRANRLEAAIREIEKVTVP